MNENRKYKYIYSLLGIMTFFCGAIWSEAILRFITTLIADSVQQSLIPIILSMIFPTLLFCGITYLFLHFGKRTSESEFTRMGKYYVLLGLLSWVLGIIWFFIWLALVCFVFSFFFETPWYYDIVCPSLLILPIAIFTILLCFFRVYGIDHFKCWNWKFSLINLIVAVICTALSLVLSVYIMWFI